MTKIYFQVYFALLALLALTTGLAYVRMGPHVNTALSLFIGAVKAVLVVLYFMELKADRKLTSVFAVAGFFWLGILLTLALADYVSRGWLPTGQ